MGTAAEIALRHYYNDEAIFRSTWQQIILLHLRHGASLSDADCASLLQQSWFMEFLNEDY